MGQYFVVCNLDKKEFIHPHKFGDGFKLLEFGCSGNGTMTALALLLRQSDGSGGGDFHEADRYPIVGSWAGNRITIVGDYDSSDLYEKTHPPKIDGIREITEWVDVSEKVFEAMVTDEYILKSFVEGAMFYYKRDGVPWCAFLDEEVYDKYIKKHVDKAIADYEAEQPLSKGIKQIL